MMDTKAWNEPLAVLALVVENLESHNVPYFVGGSFASSLRGEFRMTNDFDFVCEFTPDSLNVFISSIETDFYVDRQAAMQGGSQSERQLRDIKSVIAVNQNLDYEYLNHWAKNLGVSKLLEQVLAAKGN